MMPPRGRASFSALVLVAIAWVLLGLVFALRTELADEYVRSEAWRGQLRRVLLGVSGLLALGSLVPAISGARRAAFRSGLALLLAVGWCALVGWRLLNS